MANIKDINTSSSKWVARASVAGPDYTKGIQNPRVPWQTAAASAQANWQAGVTAAAAAGRFASGVNKAGNAKWQTNATTKGPARYTEGVALAQGAWQTAFGPYQTVISNVTLPPRGPVGSPQNLQRVSAITQALRAAKTSAAK